MSLPLSQPSFFDSTEAGAPTLNNVAGSLLEVLRACLINGFGAKAVTSIEVASGVATATASAHGYMATYGKILLVEGATDAGLNGRVQPTAVTTNTFTYAAPGVADGTYTGSITAKRAPLGWVELFTGTNVAVFERTDVEATPWQLRINDSAAAGATAIDARALVVGGATDVDTYTDVGSRDWFWSKGNNTATARKWALVGTSRGFYLAVGLGSGQAYRHLMHFVDFDSLDGPADGDCMSAGAAVAVNGGVSPQTNASLLGPISNTALAAPDWYPRSARSSAGVLNTKVSLVGYTNSPYDSGAVNNTTIPTPIGVVPFAYPVPMVEERAGGATPIVGMAPGMAGIIAKMPYADLQVVMPVAMGRSFLALTTSSGWGASSTGAQVLIDLTGPWNA